jgi:hypothetical protein
MRFRYLRLLKRTLEKKLATSAGDPSLFTVRTHFDEVLIDQRVLQFFRALALKEELHVRFVANAEQLDMEKLEVVAFARDPWPMAS